MNTLGLNQSFAIKKQDGTPFHDLVLHKAAYESVIMSLGDKITGDVYYVDNTLAVTMQEYIEYNGVHYVLVNPPTIVKEGMVSDNGQLKGMTKYSFTFYHPMYMLGNFPFTDVAVSSDETQYLSESKKFSWCGTGIAFIAKLNKNLENTQWVVVTSGNAESLAKLALLPSDIPTSKSTDTAKSNVLTFDNAFIADALKTMYDTWEVPFVIDNISEGEYFDSNNNDYYDDNKRFVIVVGLPSNEILDENEEPFVFQFGKGVGLKNNSRTPRNNKIVTRIAGIGSERNIPYGYPQVRWYGTSGAKFTYGDAAGVYTNVTIGGHTFAKVVSYPIYKGILGGEYVELIKHPFTRKNLMPSIYAATLFNKISPYLANGSVNTNYNPDLTIVDYYDAIGNTYPNPIVPDVPSYETHQFDNVYPRLGSAEIVGVLPYDEPKETTSTIFPSVNLFLNVLNESIGRTNNGNEKAALQRLYNAIYAGMRTYTDSNNGGSYTFSCTVTNDGNGTMFVKYTSDGFNIDTSVTYAEAVVEWDDSIDDEGNYKQSYFKITLPQLNFDLYACASITEQMNIVMRSGACIGCTFEVSIDWDDYKNNFFHDDGSFDPTPHTSDGDGHVRDATKYPNSASGQITVIVKKDLDTFGALMPNTYQQPVVGDEFVITGISLPESYITNAELELETTSQQYMLENNVYYYDYPLKFDEHFLATHTDILSQIRNNTIIEFKYGNETPNKKLYVKQISVKYEEKPLPQYDITLTDDVEIVLNQIGQVTDDVSRLRLQLTDLMRYYGMDGVLAELIAEKLSRVNNDIAEGRITFKQGLVAAGNIITQSSVQSDGFESGLYTGKGWRIDELGNAELESLRVRSYLEVIELLINRVQAMEGDTMFSDNDQIEKVTPEYDANNQLVSYKLSLKEKWSGYVTAQLEGNILKGIINTLAAKQAGVSDESNNNTNKQGVDDGGNRYYTSWMRVTETHNSLNSTLDVNEIRVVLYGDNDTPANKNFAPCELMTIARWGCLDADDNASASVKASVKRRQNVFYLSASEGRIVKLTGVNKPILEDGNYGMVFGTIPDFIKEWDSWDRLVAQHPHLEDRDYLYAQGLIYEDLVHVDIKGAPVPVTVDCGDWVDGEAVDGETIVDEYGDTVTLPTICHGIYFNVGWNPKSQQFERHTVRHNNCTWLCLQNQPVTVGGLSTYYEPMENSLYWKQISKPATTYKLLPSVDVIKTAKTGTNTYDPATASLTCGYTKSVGDIITLVADATSLIDNTYCIYFRRKSRGGDYESKYWLYTDSKARAFLSSMSLSDFDAVEFYIANKSNAPSYDIVTRASFLSSLTNVIDHVNVPVIADGKNGTSPIIADLDNEMDGVACDAGGDSDHNQTCTTTASLLQGSTKKSFTLKIREWDEDDQEYNEITQSGSTLTDVVINWTNNSDNSKTITFTFGEGVTINDKREFIVVMIADDMEYKAVFTVNGVLPGANGEPATLYQIIPSQDKMAFSRLAAGGLTPDEQYLTFTVKKTVGNETTIIYTAQLAQNNLIARYSTSDPPASKTSGVAWGTGSGSGTTQITFNTIGNAVIGSGVSFQQIYIALFDSNGTLHDRETIPVIKDGANGADGENGQDMRENIIDNSEPEYDALVSSASATNNHRYYTTDKTYAPSKIPTDGTKMSGQIRVRLYGCSFIGGAGHVMVYFQSVDGNEGKAWPVIGAGDVTANGTFEFKHENFALDANGGTWDGSVHLRLDNFNNQGHVYIDHVKLEVGKKCSDWCLSENDKIGASGDSIRNVTVFYHDDSQPARPSGNTIPPSGWSLSPFGVSHDNTSQFTDVLTGTYKGWRKGSGSGQDDSGVGELIKDIIRFVTTRANEKVVIRIKASCEESSGEDVYDFIFVGSRDSDYYMDSAGDVYKVGTSILLTDDIPRTSIAAGTEEKTITVTFPNAGTHSLCIGYRKDSSTSDNDDCGWYIVESTIWSSVATFVNNVLDENEWSIPVRWNGTSGSDGTNGTNGQNAVAYQIIVQSASAMVGANGMLNASVVCTVNRTSGSNVTQNYSYGNIRAIIGNTTVQLSKAVESGVTKHTLSLTNVNWSNYGSPKSIVLQYYIAPTYATLSIPITIQGQMGRNIYFAGMIDDVVGTTFTATDYEAPYVNIGTSSSPICYVYIGSNGTFTFPSASSYANSENWELMETNFNYLITKAMFSDFAKLGSAIFNKDYMFSQYLDNEFVMLGSQQNMNTSANTLISGQTSLPVVAGVTYNLVITCASSGSSNYATLRVYYNTKSDWSGTTNQGVADVENRSTTSSNVTLTFTAEYDGYVRLYWLGAGSVTRIVSKTSANYNEVSPMFINGDNILLADNTQSTNSTTQRSVVALPIPVNAGRQYTVTFYGYVSGSGGTGYVYIVQNGSNIQSTSFSNTSPAQKSITFTASASGDVYIQFKSSSSSYYTYVYQMYIKCDNAMISKVAVNWLNGYAHFAGDNVRFNPDGSGFVAGGNISWDTQGNANFVGQITATSGNITGIMSVGNTSGNHVRLNPSSSGAHIEGMGYDNNNSPITKFTLGFETNNELPELYRRQGYLRMGKSLLTDGFMKVGGKSDFISLLTIKDYTYAYLSAYSGLFGDLPALVLSASSDGTKANAKIFKIQQHEGGMAYITLDSGMNITGLPTNSSGASAGDVYVDSNGYLRIKTS